jgi:hypothetical protein
MFYFHPCGSKNAKKMGVFASMIHSHKGHMSWNILEYLGMASHQAASSKVAECSQSLPSGSKLLCLTDEDTELLTGKLD